MKTSLIQINPDYLVYAGIIGCLIGILFLIFFIYRRIRRILSLLTKKKNKKTGLIAGLRNLTFVFLWTAVFGMMLFVGFFLRAYQAFTLEKPVAEISLRAVDEHNTRLIILTQPVSPDSQLTRRFLVKGDQWMLEGDILKWDNWLNFIGLHTRYRLTRLRGRYTATEDEISQPQTIYSLVEDENHPLWKYLYKYGQHFPFISTVYGNAAFQNADNQKRYLVFVSTSGFVVRESVDRQ